MNEAAWLTLAGIAVTAVLGFIGAWGTARASRATAARVAELDSFRLQLASRDDQIAAWRNDAEALRKLRDEAEARDRQRIAELTARLDELTARLDELSDWAQQVTELMRRADLEFPEPPILRRP